LISAQHSCPLDPDPQTISQPNPDFQAVCRRPLTHKGAYGLLLRINDPQVLHRACRIA
jgi:hypothetical protein